MKQILKIVLLVVLAIGAFAFSSETSAQAATEKVYREYKLPTEVKKFPIKLTNGLTVTTAKVNGKTVPVIKKGSTTVWQGKALATNSKIRFTVSKNQDTFFYYSQTVSGTGNIDLVGVSKSGKVFLQDTLKEDVLLKIDFLSANKIEVGIESDYGQFASIFFLLYKDGSVEELTYFDKEFATSAKQGKLKWTTGALGTKYKNLQPKVAYLDGKINMGEIEMYNTWKLAYGFFDGKKYGVLEPNQTVKMMLYRNIVADMVITKTTLRSYLGAPIDKSNDGTYEAYKAGKYYLIVRYKEGIVTLEFVTKDNKSFYGL